MTVTAIAIVIEMMFMMLLMIVAALRRASPSENANLPPRLLSANSSTISIKWKRATHPATPPPPLCPPVGSKFQIHPTAVYDTRTLSQATRRWSAPCNSSVIAASLIPTLCPSMPHRWRTTCQASTVSGQGCTMCGVWCIHLDCDVYCICGCAHAIFLHDLLIDKTSGSPVARIVMPRSQDDVVAAGEWRLGWPPAIALV